TLSLPWTHYVSLLGIENAHARAFYEAEALRGGWTSRQLDRQIQSQFYERIALSRNKAAMLRKGHARPDDVVTAEAGQRLAGHGVLCPRGLVLARGDHAGAVGAERGAPHSQLGAGERLARRRVPHPRGRAPSSR